MKQYGNEPFNDSKNIDSKQHKNKQNDNDKLFLNKNLYDNLNNDIQ